MKISIVTTMYYSAKYIKEFYERSKAQADKNFDDYEIIYVNDGSPDDSLKEALQVRAKDEKVKVIDLSRNFGQHKAILTGLRYADGDYVLQIDCDLEEEPELLEKFYEKLRQEDADVIYGVQKTRKGDYYERLTGSIFYTLFNMIASTPIPKNISTIRLMTKRYKNALLQHEEREVFIAGLWEITGFKQLPMLIDKHSKGSTTYNFRKKMSIIVNSLTSFTVKPLVFIFYLGFIIMFLSIAASAYLVYRNLVYDDMLMGWSSLFISIGMFSGLIIMCLGIIGMYLSKVFMETKRRPLTIIRGIYGITQMNEISHDSDGMN